jgi:hypothetical protein
MILLSSPLITGAQNFQYVLGTDFYAPSDSTLPQKGVSFTDPDFHTTIVRITDKTDGYIDSGIENEYSQSDPENCDGTLVILRGNDHAEWYLYDTTTYQMTKKFDSSFTYGIEPEPRWDSTNTKVFYYLYGTELRTYNVETDVWAVVHDFKADYPSASYTTTHVYGTPSLDQRYWSFLIRDIDYNLISVVVYDKQTDSIVGHREVFPDDVRSVSMDVSGSHCLIGFETHVFQVCTRDFSSIKDLPIGAEGHDDFALTADDRDVLVYQNVQNDYICMTDLDTLVETKLLEIPFSVNTDIGLHISGNSADKPGWVLVSTYGAKQTPPSESHSWMDTQLFMLQLQENPTVWRIAHTQAYQSDSYNGDKNFFAEAYATINQAGSRVYFGSNWGDFTPEYTDTYLVMLPSDWTTISSETPPSTTSTLTLTPTPTQTGQTEQGQTSMLEYILVFVVATFAVAAVVAVVFLKKKKQMTRTNKKLN